MSSNFEKASAQSYTELTVNPIKKALPKTQQSFQHFPSVVQDDLRPALGKCRTFVKLPKELPSGRRTLDQHLEGTQVAYNR
jgi:hypothetical protein